MLSWHIVTELSRRKSEPSQPSRIKRYSPSCPELATHELTYKSSLDMPLTDSINGQLEQKGQVAHYTPPANTVSEFGISDIRFRCETTQCGHHIRTDAAIYTPITINSHVQDSWVRNVEFQGFLSSVQIKADARRLTIQDCVIRRDAPSDRKSGMCADISIAGTQVLVLRCCVLGAKGTESIAVVIQARCPGPNAAVGCKAEFSGFQTHARMSSGFLVDGCDGAFVEMTNRHVMGISSVLARLELKGGAGSGHGWTTTNSVAWNCTARKVVCKKPPTGQNFAIGCITDKWMDSDGEIQSKGAFRYRFVALGMTASSGHHVQPLGLFAYQLSKRVEQSLAEAVLNMSLGPSSSGAPLVVQRDRP
jgi:hypothetical protein